MKERIKKKEGKGIEAHGREGGPDRKKRGSFPSSTYSTRSKRILHSKSCPYKTALLRKGYTGTREGPVAS